MDDGGEAIERKNRLGTESEHTLRRDILFTLCEHIYHPWKIPSPGFMCFSSVTKVAYIEQFEM